MVETPVAQEAISIYHTMVLSTLDKLDRLSFLEHFTQCVARRNRHDRALRTLQLLLKRRFFYRECSVRRARDCALR